MIGDGVGVGFDDDDDDDDDDEDDDDDDDDAGDGDDAGDVLSQRWRDRSRLVRPAAVSPTGSPCKLRSSLLREFFGIFEDTI